MKTPKKTNMTMVPISLVIFGIVFFWGFPVFGEELNKEQKEIWKAVETRWEYYKQGDLESVMSSIHDEAVFWLRNGLSPLGKNAIETLIGAWIGYYPPLSYEFEPLSINIFGNVANVYYHYKWKGNMVSGIGRVGATFIKQDYKWLLIGYIGASCDRPINCGHPFYYRLKN